MNLKWWEHKFLINISNKDQTSSAQSDISKRQPKKQVISKLIRLWLACPWCSWCPPVHCSLFSDTPQFNGFIWLGLQGSLHKTNYKTFKMLQLRKWLHRQQAQWTTAYLQRCYACSLLQKNNYIIFDFQDTIVHLWKNH